MNAEQLGDPVLWGYSFLITIGFAATIVLWQLRGDIFGWVATQVSNVRNLRTKL